MRMLFIVDHAAALRDGIDAPNSTESIDLDPKELTTRQREILAAITENGYDCTQRGLSKLSEEISGTFQYDMRLSVRSPDLAGLRQGIDQLEVRHRTAHEQYRSDTLAKREKAERKIRDLIAAQEGKVESRTIGLDRNGKRACYDRDHVVSFSTEIPSQIPYSHAENHAGDEVLNDLSAARLQINAERGHILELVYANLQNELAKQKAESAALFSRLPELMRDKNDAGYCDPFELEQALRDLIILDALSNTNPMA